MKLYKREIITKDGNVTTKETYICEDESPKRQSNKMFIALAIFGSILLVLVFVIGTTF